MYPFHHFSSVAQWCPNLCDPIYFSMPGFTLFSLWLHLFILSGVISPFLGTYRPEEFIFQCHVFLPFHTVHGVLKARILKWFAISFSSGPHFVKCFVKVIKAEVDVFLELSPFFDDPTDVGNLISGSSACSNPA